jgi:hypothetical protein
MLLTMKAYVEAMRALCYVNAAAIDRGHAGADDATRLHNQELADLLTPISKGWCTDVGSDVASLGIQVHGGMGFIEETGVAQHYRDVRIAASTKAPTAFRRSNLVGRKLPMRRTAPSCVEPSRTMLWSSTANSRRPDLDDLRGPLTQGRRWPPAKAAEWLLKHRTHQADVLAGANRFLRMADSSRRVALLAAPRSSPPQQRATTYWIPPLRAWLDASIATARSS